MTEEQAAQLADIAAKVEQIYKWLNHSASGWPSTAKMVNELRQVTISTVPTVKAGELLTRIRNLEPKDEP